MISNFSRSFVHSMPAQNTTFIYNAAIPASYFTNSFNLLDPNPTIVGRNVPNLIRVYTDRTRMNYRTITYQLPTAEAFTTSLTITGMTSTGLTNETITTGILDNTVKYSVNQYLYLISATLTTGVGATAITQVTIGYGFGTSQWIMHDGSPFNNYVNITGTATWSIQGTLQKWNRSTSPVGGGNTGAIIYNPLPMQIQSNLTSQTADTANPIVVTAPYVALQLVTASGTTGQVDWYFANQQLL